MGFEPIQPDSSVLLTHSKKGANPALTWVFFDPTQRDFLPIRIKNELF